MKFHYIGKWGYILKKMPKKEKKRLGERLCKILQGIYFLPSNIEFTFFRARMKRS
jgi:hypothetical protein